MKNCILIYMLIINLVFCSTVPVTTQCQCNELYMENECVSSMDCSWDLAQQLCINKKTDQTPREENTTTFLPQIPTQVSITSGTSLLCNLIQETVECKSTSPCAWIENKCQHHTDCSAYSKISKDCSEIQSRCTTRGDECIELNKCSSYNSKITCDINNYGKYCIWQNSEEKCQDITQCSELPLTLTSDSQCRFQISWCTVNETGGCIESGENCKDQISEKQCITNRIGDQRCLWTDNQQCVDLTCQNAPISLTTDDQCKTLLSSCTTKKDGGCTQRMQCSDAEIKEACLTDIDNNKCFWDGNQCQNRNCSNAPQLFNTNGQCSEYLVNCITNGNGCVENTGCESAIIQQACDKTLTGILCHWDGTKCKEKTCENAGPLIIGHKACNEFVPNCTAKVNDVSGCMLISCLSAPLINITNDQCEQYLPDSNCITKRGGGCKVNIACENIDTEVACIKDINKKDCYWSNGCKLKTCANAPSSFNTQELCQDYSKKCTLGIDNKCVDYTCENFTDQEDCTVDFNNAVCKFLYSCKDKNCSMAPKTITKYEDCQQYLPSCILDNSGQGCIDIPDDCGDLILNQQCKLNKQGQKCGWFDNKCIDYTCYTASIDNNSTEKCQIYKQGCVVNNSLNGCMDLPDQCSDRKQQENCEIANENKCQWDTTNSNCFEISCQNAHLVSLKDHVTQFGCWNYYQLKCIINDTNDGCLTKPDQCDGLSENACGQDKVLTNNQNCYWDLGSLSCKAIACESITFTGDQTADHDTCNSIMNNCTVNDSLTGCVQLTSCDKYTSDQCYIDKNYYTCEVLDTCVNVVCENANNSPTYATYSACQSYSKQCTLTQQSCALKQSFCSNYLDEASCLQNTLNKKTKCIWDPDQGCLDDTPACNQITGTGLTPGYCQYMNSSCTVNLARTSCIDDAFMCQYVTTKDACVWTQGDLYCAWVSNKCVVDCTAIPGPYFDIDYCFQTNYLCTVKLDGTGCVKQVSTCKSTALANCTQDSNFNYCYPKKGTTTTCTSATTTPLTVCSTVTGARLTYMYCLMISNFVCSVNSTQTACVTSKANCSDYQPADCFNSDTSPCVYLNGVCTDLIEDDNVCNNIKQYGVTVYTDNLCQIKSYSCIAKADKTGCVLGSLPDTSACSYYTGTNLTLYYCLDKSVNCSVNIAKSACVDLQDYCQDYALADCYYASEDGECIVVNNACTQKSCDQVTATTNANCQSYSTNCILRSGGCSTKSTCDSYHIKTSCVQSLDGQDCLWNTSTAKCVIKSCLNAESSTYFDSAEECKALGNCTVKNNNISIGQGCMPLASCDTYIIQEQCNQDDKGVLCIWNTNDSANPMCGYKSCSTALLSINNHNDCQVYLPECTVNMVNSNLQGCTELKSCQSYVFEAQCIISSERDINNSNIICGWNGSVCANKSCLTAGKGINGPIQCSNYFKNCTVNSTNDGCITIPDTCEEMTKYQCFNGSLDFSNRQCIWMDNTCKTKTCLNFVPIDNKSSCEAYLFSCTTSVKKCFTSISKICSDFKYTSDIECSQVIQNLNCTTDGSQCIDRKQCSDVQNKTGCTKDVQGIDCEWVINDDQSEGCKIKSCLTAPKKLLTEESCMRYYPFSDGQICTTKRNGGCMIKGNCNSLTLESICNIDIDGNKCVWDNQQQFCRNPDCQDLYGITYQQCQLQDKKCIIGINNKCVLMTSCEVINSKELCLLGTNGPCIWLNDYQNLNKSLGACFSYDSCKSFKWKTDQLCKLISPSCTTNGIECVGLTTCSWTNTNGGCVSGIDGVCVQTPIKAGDKNLICKKFTTCNQVYYLTHDECQQANRDCTSDYKIGCISLTNCQAYTYQGQCQFNNVGTLIDKNNLIVSSGKCVWDQQNKSCRDEKCSDIQLSTESDCLAKFRNCTSDGQSCLMKGECSSYVTLSSCKFTGGTDGPCLWVTDPSTNISKCRIRVCTEIENGTSITICSVLPNCVSDGENCINRTECQSYLTKTACQSLGTDDVCIWKESSDVSEMAKCLKMGACEEAKDEFTCQQAKNRCYWSSQKNNCIEHTCETFYSQENKCKHFPSWDQKDYNICSKVNNTCISADAENLKAEECFQASGQLYSWIPYFNKCLRCEKIIHNEISNEDDKPTLSGLILSLMIGQLLQFIV